MNSFITRLMVRLVCACTADCAAPRSPLRVFLPPLPQGGLEGEGLAMARGNMAAPELARLLYWLLVVGYSLRTIEVRFDLDAQLGLPPSAPDASDC